MLSGVMMLEHLSLGEASRSLMKAIERTLAEGTLTQDLARMSGSSRACGTKEFSEAVAARI
jgi:isocitrate dehydrogenase